MEKLLDFFFVSSFTKIYNSNFRFSQTRKSNEIRVFLKYAKYHVSN